MFGPKPPHLLILEKAKKWWEIMEKLHLPELRKKFSSEDLIFLAKERQKLEIVIRNLELQSRVELKRMIDFQRLTKAFFKKNKYSYGVPIKEEEEN